MVQENSSVIYVRVSTEEQTKGHSLDAQEARLRRLASERALVVVAVYAEAISTRKARRPQRDLALSDARAGAVLLSASMDRVARNMAENVALIAEARDGHLRWLTADMELDTTTASGRMSAHVKAAVAEYERDRLSERTKEGLAMARQKGVRLGRERLIEPALEERIREMKETMTLKVIAQTLNAEGVRSPSGGLWARSTLHRVVTR